jgi:hypothetical protein
MRTRHHPSRLPPGPVPVTSGSPLPPDPPQASGSPLPPGRPQASGSPLPPDPSITRQPIGESR